MSSRDFLVLLIIFASMILFVIIRGVITYKNYMKMIDAVYAYRKWCIAVNKKPLVDYDDLLPVRALFVRFWDFGHKHILPLDKYRYIKPYVGN